MNILIVNVHSGLNLGDDAIMQETVNSLRREFPSATITVAANDPQSWQRYPHVQVVGSLCTWVADCRLGHFRAGLYRMPLVLALLLLLSIVHRLFGARWLVGSPQKRRLLAAYYDADLVLSCGGGNFYAHHGKSPALFWALMTLAFAWGLGKKIVMLPQSIGPIEGRLQRGLARWVFGRAALIMLREPVSLAFVRDTLRLENEVVLLPDLAFGLPDPRPGEMLANEGRLKIGITAIDRGAQQAQFGGQVVYEAALARLLAQLQQVYDAQIYVFVQCYGPSPDQDDRRVAQRLSGRVQAPADRITVLDTFRDATAIKSAYAQMDFVIATRMHTAIFALSSAVPVVAIGYQPKSRGMMTTFGLEAYYCDIGAASYERLLAMARQAIDNRHALRQQIAARHKKVRQALQEWPTFLTD